MPSVQDASLESPAPASDAAPAERADARADCLHCGLTIPGQRRRRGDPFCCEGCRRVHALIHETGLERYYEIRRGPGGPPPTLRPDAFTWLTPLVEDDGGSAGRPRRLTLDVQGIHCAACVWLLRELFLRRPGAIDLRVNPALGKADFTWIPERADLAAYLAEAEAFGYRFGPDRKRAGSRAPGIVIRLGLCAAAAMNVMIFSFCFYAGLGPQDGALYALFGRLNLALTLFAVLVGGWVFFRSAWRGLRRGIVHLDLPIALSIVLAFAGSVYAHVVDGPRAAYFDTVAAFVTLMLVGRWLQERVLERNRMSLLANEGVENLYVRRHGAGGVESVPARQVERGDVIWVVPGDLVPVASTVLHQAARFSLDWITGESEVRSAPPGEAVPAGAINAGETTAVLAASEPFADSQLIDLLGSGGGDGLVADTDSGGGDGSAGDSASGDENHPGGGTARRAGGDLWWRRVGTAYVFAVLALAASGFLVWIGRGPGRALAVAVSILAVTCPCALGLATPLAQELAHLALRRRGIFLRRGSFLERALRVRKIVFDKTGTVTCGRLACAPASRRALLGLETRERETLQRMVEQSNHPVSRALLAELESAPANSGAREPLLPVREIAGEGLEAIVDGRLWRLGRPEFALRAVASESPPSTATAPASDRTVLGVDGRLAAAFDFVEEIKPDAAEEVRLLRARGFEVFLWSGDSPEKTRAVAEAVGIPEDAFAGGLDPRGKAARVRELDRDDTMMIGDGLNDAPSFEAALCTATPAIDRPALPGRSDFYFLGDGIEAVRRAIEMAGRLRSVVRANLVFAAGYNVVALALCFQGRVDPLVAAVIMPLSSVLVVGHTAWRLTGRRLGWTS